MAVTSTNKLFNIAYGQQSTLGNVDRVAGNVYFSVQNDGHLYLQLDTPTDTVERLAISAPWAAAAAFADNAGAATTAATAAQADKWTTAREFTIISGDGTAVNVDGTGPVALKLPSTITATLNGSATKWTNSMKIVMSDNDGTNKLDNTGFNYNANGFTLKLPATIKATLTGTADLAKKWVTDATLAAGTGPVTVTPSRTTLNAGDSVAFNTSISNGQITNAMLAGSIANSKLANSKVNIAGSDVSLGGSITATQLRANLGLTSALRYVGQVSSLTDGSTSTNPFGSSVSYTAAVGDVVIDESGREFVYTDQKTWSMLGDNSVSFKTVQDAVTDPTASGTSTTFIKTISQNANGVITATKASLPTATTSAAGIASFSSTYFNVSNGAVSLKSLGSLNAASASKWYTTRSFVVKDSTAAHSGTAVDVNGESDVILKLPATIDATVTTAETANKTAAALSINGKSFNGSTAIDVGTIGIAYGGTGNTKGYSQGWNTAVPFQVTDNDGTNKGTAVDVSGQAGKQTSVVLTLPATIKASLTGNASSATKLATGRTFKVNLASTNASSKFDGSGNITDVGVSGVLGVANGGTGRSNGTVSAADKWVTAIDLQIGATSKTVDGSADVTFTAAEIGSTVVWQTWD